MLGKLDCHGLTDVGKRRANNEDQFLIADLVKSMRVQGTSLDLEDQTRLFGNSQGTLFLVADGVGGHAAGERASQIAVDSLTSYLLNTLHWCLRHDQEGEDDFVDELKQVLEHCETSIRASAEVHAERQGMGTTLTLAYVIWPRLFVVHAGDSRCYVWRDGKLRQITRDHSMAQQLVDKGALAPKDAESSQWSNVLYNIVGGSSDAVVPEAHKALLAIGDTLLLCTDGLTKHVPDESIAACLDRGLPAAETCQALVDAANAAGGSDNITVVVARFREATARSAEFSAESVLDEPAGLGDPMAETLLHLPGTPPAKV
jgi:protein phosphatase